MGLRVGDHKTTLATLRVEIDANIYKQVIAINKIPGIRSLYSCEGDEKSGGYINFISDFGDKHLITTCREFITLCPNENDFKVEINLEKGVKYKTTASIRWRKFDLSLLSELLIILRKLASKND